MPKGIEVSAVSPFLLKDMLVAHAGEVGEEELELIDASRGAANWQNRPVLEAWHALGLYAVSAAAWPRGCSHVALPLDSAAPHRAAFGRFAEGLTTASAELQEGCALLARIFDHLAEHVLPDRSRDRIVFEFAQAVAGRIYPSPPTLDFVQPIITRYLAPLLFSGHEQLAGEFRVLMCEGATTGIAQIAATLARNRLLKPGDAVALWWPTYEPLRDLVECQLSCRAIPIRRDRARAWAAPPEELRKLRDPAVRLAITVSPGNPVPVVTDPASLDALEGACAERPELLILGDYVYVHLLDEPVETEIGRLPLNTIGVYSFSKDFGLAGARDGCMLLHPDCVAERALRELPEADAREPASRYRLRSLQPRALPLGERMVADSRGVSFVHMSGLSTPLQALACLCAAYDLVEPESQRYFEWLRGQLRERVDALYAGLGLPAPEWAAGPTSRYATALDLCEVAQARGGEELAAALRGRDIWSFMRHLAHRWRVVLTPGERFGTGEWSVRACLPSVEVATARELGRRVSEAVSEFAAGIDCPWCEPRA